MAEITRRWFLFGSAAVVATVAAGLPPETKLAPAPRAFAVRRIRDITFAPVHRGIDEAVHFTVGVGDHHLLSGGVRSRGMMRWCSPDVFADILQLPHELLTIQLKGGDFATVDLVYEETDPDGKVEVYYERHDFEHGEVVITREPMERASSGGDF